MHLYGMRSTLSAFFVIALIVLPAADTSAQGPKVLAPHDPIAPRVEKPVPQTPVPGSTVAGPWIVDSHFQSNIYLKNIVETSAVTVTPVLHLSDGTEQRLAPVHLEPSGIANIDINASLEALGIVPNASLSGWVELQYNWAWDPICAMIRVLDVTRSLIFTFGFGTPESMRPQSPHISGRQVTEGMWWKQEPKVTGFVALANTTSKTITATVDVSDTHASVLGSHTVTVRPQGMEILDLLEMQTASTNEGGIRVSYTGEQDALLISGALEDAGNGYDANIPFAPPAHPAPPMAKATVAQGIVELGLMAGAADPYMHFPPGTIFTPYSVLRNISSAPISVTPTLWWMQGTVPKSFQLSPFRLLPFETRTLDVPSMLLGAGLKDFSGYANLAFDTQGQTGLLLASGSVDQTYNYSFPVVPRGILPSAKKSIASWSTGNGDDTMVTMWNPADEVQNFTFRLVFSGGHYDRLITLQPRVTYMFSISEIMASPGPDLDGNVIPVGLHEGSAEILGIEADNQSILIVEDAAIYNVRKATCGGSCQNCDGATSWSVPLNPFGVATGQNWQENLVAQYCSGGQYNLTSSSTWSSSNTNIATVNTGLVHGVSPGSMTLSAGNTSAPVCAPQCNPYGSCPAYFGGGGQSQGNVKTPPHISDVVPDPLVVGTSGPMGIAGTGFSSVSGPVTVNISGGGATVTSATVANDSSINATYTVASGTATGGRNLTVSFGSGEGVVTTNSLPITISAAAPIPASASIDSNTPHAYSNQTYTSCDGQTTQPNSYGYQRCLVYQIKDGSGNPIFENFAVQESVTTIASNVTSEMHNGNYVSNPAGQFSDELHLISGSQLPANACIVVKQTITASGNTIRVNCLQYNQVDVTITDDTGNQSQCSSANYSCP